MKHSFWPDGSAPVFIRPTWDEMKELAAGNPDTLRICEDESLVAIASGYGNTHESVIKAVREVEKLRRWHPMDYILYQHMGQWVWNPIGHFDGITSERVQLERGLEFVEPHTAQAIRDFVANWKAPELMQETR